MSMNFYKSYENSQSQGPASWLWAVRWVEAWVEGWVEDSWRQTLAVKKRAYDQEVMQTEQAETQGPVVNEWDAVQASLNGDEEAYSILVEKYQAMVGRIMWRFTQNRGEWESLIQDVFVQSWLSLKNFKGQGAFAGWLNKIAVRCGYRFWKNQEKMKHAVSLEDWSAVASTGKDSGSSSPQAAYRLVSALLGQLPSKDRLVLTLQYFEGLSADDIAIRMGWNRPMVHMRVYRAKKKLKQIISQTKGSQAKHETI